MDIDTSLIEVNQLMTEQELEQCETIICEKQWGFTRQHAYQQIKNSETISLLENVNARGHDLKARPLSPLTSK